MQAVHCTHPLPHSGLPSFMVTVPVGQTRSHRPQPMQASLTRNLVRLSGPARKRRKSGLMSLLFNQG